MTLHLGEPNEAARSAIEAIAIPSIAKAGLWLLHDFFEESHAISQSDHSVDGSYWHGILHRREGDAANAKYWLRQVGAHPILPSLRIAALEIGYDFTNLLAFVHDCVQVQGTGSEAERLAEAVQMLEWKLLYDHCCRAPHR